MECVSGEGHSPGKRMAPDQSFAVRQMTSTEALLSQSSAKLLLLIMFAAVDCCRLQIPKWHSSNCPSHLRLHMRPDRVDTSRSEPLDLESSYGVSYGTDYTTIWGTHILLFEAFLLFIYFYFMFNERPSNQGTSAKEALSQSANPV